MTSQCHIVAEQCLSQAGRLTRTWVGVPSACGCGYDAPFSESPYLSPHLLLFPPPLSILLSPYALQSHLHLLPGPFPRGLGASDAQGNQSLSLRVCNYVCASCAGMPYQVRVSLVHVCMSVT